MVRSIHQVHDEAKDKDFELELSWISPASGWKHVSVPQHLADAAEAKAKAYALLSSTGSGTRDTDDLAYRILAEANEMEE